MDSSHQAAGVNAVILRHRLNQQNNRFHILIPSSEIGLIIWAHSVPPTTQIKSDLGLLESSIMVMTSTEGRGPEQCGHRWAADHGVNTEPGEGREEEKDSFEIQPG